MANRMHIDPYWAGYEVTHTLADSRRANWEEVLEQFKPEIKKILEIGSYEGQSAIFWHKFFGAELTCIDPWEGFTVGCDSAQEVEDHFNQNMAGLPVTKIKAKSSPTLSKMVERGLVFDLIYVDGDHTRLQVMIDSCLGWQLLRSGGIMVWDDYREYLPGVMDRPTPAIDGFVGLMADELEIVKDSGAQLIVRKR